MWCVTQSDRRPCAAVRGPAGTMSFSSCKDLGKVENLFKSSVHSFKRRFKVGGNCDFTQAENTICACAAWHPHERGGNKERWGAAAQNAPSPCVSDSTWREIPRRDERRPFVRRCASLVTRLFTLFFQCGSSNSAFCSR